MPTPTRDETLEPLASPLKNLVGWLAGSNTPFVIIGGVAASLQGKPRFTADIDAVILTDESRLDSFFSNAKAHGFTPRIPNAVAFARENRILLLVHEADSMKIDLSLGILPFELEMIDRAVRIHELGIEIPIAAPEYLITMKVLAFRGRDVDDIENLLDANPTLDIVRIRNCVQALADGLESPEIVDRWTNLLARRQSSESAQKAPRMKRNP